MGLKRTQVIYIYICVYVCIFFYQISIQAMCLESLCAQNSKIKGSLGPFLPPKTPKKMKNQDRFFFRDCSLKKKHPKIQPRVDSFYYSPGPSGQHQVINTRLLLYRMGTPYIMNWHQPFFCECFYGHWSGFGVRTGLGLYLVVAVAEGGRRRRGLLRSTQYLKQLKIEVAIQTRMARKKKQ